MVMPSSGPITMAQAHAEFGLGYNINAYYGCDDGVPTSGAISLAHLYGKKKRTPYRYYKLQNMKSSNPAAYAPGLNEIELKGVAGGADLMGTGGVQLVSSATYGTGANLTDNGVGTGWIANSGMAPHYVVLGLPSAQIVREITLHGTPLSPAYGIVSFDFYGANSVAELSGANNGTFIKSFTIPPNLNGWVVLSV